MEGASRGAEDVGDEVTGRLRLLYVMAAQMLGFGPVLATKMSMYSTISLPWGLGAAGAETVKRGVDTDNTEGACCRSPSHLALYLPSDAASRQLNEF